MVARILHALSRRGTLGALLALLAWAGGGIALPVLHEAMEAGHHDCADACSSVGASCPAGCTEPGHHHAGHDHAACAACRVLQAPIAVASAAQRPSAPGAARQSAVTAVPSHRDAPVAPSRPRGPPAPLSFS